MWFAEPDVWSETSLAAKVMCHGQFNGEFCIIEESESRVMGNIPAALKREDSKYCVDIDSINGVKFTSLAEPWSTAEEGGEIGESYGDLNYLASACHHSRLPRCSG